MVTVETMYGVNHGGEVTIGGLVTSQFEVYPSADLTQQLHKLPAGTKVGIEIFDPAEFSGGSIVIGNNKRCEIAAASYWGDLIDICHGAKLDIAFLDDFTTWKEHAEKKYEALTILKNHQRGTRRAERLSRSPDPQKEIAARSKAFKALAEADYIFMVKREDKITENIVRYSPRVVIVGLGHGDYMIQAVDEMREKGLEVRNYKREVVDEGMLHWSLFNNYRGSVRAKLEEDSTPNPKILAERKSIIRQYRAVTEGRITANGKPDYIGTWEIGCPPRGLFEVFVEGPHFRGIIEDCLGTATFTGLIAEAEVLFAKNYDPSRSTEDAFKETLLYHGVLNNGQYEGTFGTHEQVAGKFAMRRFNE